MTYVTTGVPVGSYSVGRLANTGNNVARWWRRLHLSPMPPATVPVNCILPKYASKGRIMTIAQLIPIAIQVSLGIIVFCVGLNAGMRHVIDVFRKPRLIIRSFVAMSIFMPVFAVVLVLLFDLDHPVEVAFVALALSPVPPVLPSKELEAGGAPSHIIGVLIATMLASIIFVPAATELLGWAFSRPFYVSVATVAKIVVTSVLAPLLAGLLIRALAPSMAGRIAKPLSIVATVLLVVAFVPALLSQWRAIAALFGNFTIVAAVLFVLVGLAVGHFMGGPDPDDRTVLALSTATRHPAVAVAIAHNARDPQGAVAAVLLVFLVSAIVTGPYVKWRKRRHAARGAQRQPNAMKRAPCRA